MSDEGKHPSYDRLNKIVNTIEAWEKRDPPPFEGVESALSHARDLLTRDGLISDVFSAESRAARAEEEAQAARRELVELKAQLFDAGIGLPKEGE